MGVGRICSGRAGSRWSCREQLDGAMGMRGAARAGVREHETFRKG